MIKNIVKKMSVCNLPHGNVTGVETSYTGEICCDNCEEVLAEISSDTPIDDILPCVCDVCREIEEIPEVLAKFTLNVTKPSFMDMYIPTEKTVCVCEKNKLHPIFFQDEKSFMPYILQELLIIFLYFVISIILVACDMGIMKSIVVLVLICTISELSFCQGKSISKYKEEEPKK